MSRPIAAAVFIAAVLSAALAARASVDLRSGWAGKAAFGDAPGLTIVVTAETAAGAGVAVAWSDGGS
jgi:hypothetical protein